MSSLSKRQRAIYEFITEYMNAHTYPPTVREIMKAVSLKSTSTVHTHLKVLQKLGLIEMSPQKQRTISLKNPPTTSDEGNSNEKPSDALVSTPLIGSVAAGTPIFAFDNVVDVFRLPSSLLHGADENEVFMLTVKGTSMIEAGINDGDMIIVHRGISASNGEIVVVRLDDDATVKRFYDEGDHIRLQPENSQMSPIIVPKQDINIVGKVIGLIRRY